MLMKELRNDYHQLGWLTWTLPTNQSGEYSI